MSLDSQYSFEHSVAAKVSKLETDQASMRSDIRGIFAGLDEIREVLARMQENARPNLGGLLITVIAVCTFLVTVGGLAMAPIYRNQTRMAVELTRIHEQQVQMIGNRFTAEDGRRLESMADGNTTKVAYLYGRAGLDLPQN